LEGVPPFCQEHLLNKGGKANRGIMGMAGWFICAGGGWGRGGAFGLKAMIKKLPYVGKEDVIKQ